VKGNVLDNDSDPEGDQLKVTEVTVEGKTYPVAGGSTGTITIPGKGTLVVGEKGDYTFTPELNWNGSVPDITYTVSDGQGGSDTGTLIILSRP
ncbi:MAG: cadherin-like domain-containing protein, partial [Comamonas sp.]